MDDGTGSCLIPRGEDRENGAGRGDCAAIVSCLDEQMKELSK
jgi:hypothetical protein